MYAFGYHYDIEIIEVGEDRISIRIYLIARAVLFSYLARIECIGDCRITVQSLYSMNLSNRNLDTVTRPVLGNLPPHKTVQDVMKLFPEYNSSLPVEMSNDSCRSATEFSDRKAKNLRVTSCIYWQTRAFSAISKR